MNQSLIWYTILEFAWRGWRNARRRSARLADQRD